MIEQKTANIDRLAGEIDGLTDEMNNPETGLKAVLAETQADLKTTKEAQQTETEERQAENALYQKEISNLNAAEEMLDKAIKTLKKFYEFLKRKEGAHHYESHDGKDSGGSGITQMMGATVEELEEAC